MGTIVPEIEIAKPLSNYYRLILIGAGVPIIFLVLVLVAVIGFPFAILGAIISLLFGKK